MSAKMRSTTRPTVGALTVKALGVAVASALLFSNADAAALGKLTVLSALGQPLRAEIALRAVSPDEAGSLVAKLASADAFRQANVDFNVALLSLQFAIERRGDRQFIRVSSTQPLNEPFVDMLLELSGPDGRLIREYTFLLDPPELRTMQAAQAAPMKVPQPPGAGIRQQPAPATPPGSAVQRTPLAAMPAPAGAHDNAKPGEYLVKNGNTLAGIANQYRPRGVSLDQMLVALYQANPDAFIDKNMNRMRAGEILSIPRAETATAIGNREAHGIVVAQAADFNRYRSMLAGTVAAGAARQSEAGGHSASGKIAAKVEEKATPANESKDKLKLSNALAAKGAGKAAGGAGSAEDRIAQEKAIADANARVAELEKNVSDLEKIIELKNKSLAEQQKQATAATMNAKPAAAVKPAIAPAIKAKPPVPVPAAQPSLVDDLLGNPLVLPGLGALLVALGVVGIYTARRKKRSRPFEDSIITDSSLKANSLFGSTGGQNVDTNNSVFNSNFSPSASQLDTNEVDPVAEADVYIAYGRDAQAEEILKEALRTQPERHAVRVKLLEIYSNRKDLRAFEVLATELYGLTKGEGDEWTQAAAMGAAIDPDNPLYVGDKTEGAVAAPASAVLMAPTEPLDEQGLATLLSTTQSNTSTEALSGLETDTSYFNTGLAADVPLDLPLGDEAPASMEDEPRSEPVASSNDLDFDLAGMVPEVDVSPAVVPEAPQVEPTMDIGSIDFDFLDTSTASATEDASVAEVPAATEEPPASETLVPELAPIPEFETEPEAVSTPESAESPEHAAEGDNAIDDAPLIDLPSLDSGTTEAEPMAFELPAADEPLAVSAAPATAEMGESQSDPLDFDLSGISLELNPSADGFSDGQSGEQDEHQSSGALASAGDAEMATKLDLALAYQEIGDKEGARELLDEVLKGGSAEQSERAKALLLELA